MARKSAADKALEAALKHAAELLGDDFKLPTVEDVKQDSQVAVQKKEQHSLAMEGMLLSQHYKHPLAMKQCKRCGLTFQTNYCYVSYCSDYCRKVQWEKDHGVPWDAITPTQSFWEYEQPFVIPPEFVDKLYYYSKEYVRQYEEGLIRRAPEATDQVPESESPQTLTVDPLEFEVDTSPATQNQPPSSQGGNYNPPTIQTDTLPDLGLLDFSF